MSFEALAVFAAAALAAYGAVALIERWWIGFTARRIVDRIARETGPDGSTEPARLMPESRYIVEISDSGVSCARPDRTVERVAWNDLERVEVVTTGEGPFGTDVLWVLHGSKGGCVIPQGATGERQLLERLQALPGFDNRAVIKAVGLATNGKSLCWRRSADSIEPPPGGQSPFLREPPPPPAPA